MGVGASAIGGKQEPDAMMLAETSHDSIPESHESQGEGIDDPNTEDNVGALFLQPGGLEAIRGTDVAKAFLAMTTLHVCHSCLFLLALWLKTM